MNSQVISRWKDANDIGPCYEGIAGLVRFEELLKTIGYTDDCCERAIVNFLHDNAGAVDALEEWISEQNNPDWEYELKAETPYDENEDEEEESYSVLSEKI